MLHLVGITGKNAIWHRLIACVSASDVVITWPETAALHEALQAALPPGVTCLRLDRELDAKSLAAYVTAHPTITWFDDD